MRCKHYDGLKDDYRHQVVDHAECYVQGQVHTNGLENFWSLLKRGLNGTYVSVEPFHLFRYVDEQAFRFNERQDENGDAWPLRPNLFSGSRASAYLEATHRQRTESAGTQRTAGIAAVRQGRGKRGRPR